MDHAVPQRLLERVHLREWVDGGVARGALGDAGAVVDDVLVALSVLALFLPLAFVVQVLAEWERDAAPAFVGEEVFGTLLHAGPFVLEASTGNAVAGWARLKAAAQALLVAALVILGAGLIFALDRAHWGAEGTTKRRLLHSEWAGSFPIRSIKSIRCGQTDHDCWPNVQ